MLQVISGSHKIDFMNLCAATSSKYHEIYQAYQDYMAQSPSIKQAILDYQGKSRTNEKTYLKVNQYLRSLLPPQQVHEDLCESPTL